MLNIKLLRNLGLFVLAICTVSLSIFFAHPSDARSAQYQSMINLGLIDAVKTPHDLGLDYLQRTPPQLTASLMDAIGEARGTVQSTDNLNRKIPLPSPANARVPTGVLPTTSGETHRYQAVAAVNRSSGRPEPIDNRGLDQMFAAEQANGGSYNNRRASGSSSEQFSLVADTSGSFIQARKRLTIDLILDDTRTGERFLAPDINIDAFCRDGLNAVLDDTWEFSYE